MPLKPILQSVLVIAIVAVSLSPASAQQGVEGNNFDGKPATETKPLGIIPLAEAERAGLVEVKYIPKNSLRANVMIKNKTKEEIQIGFPKVFAAVHVLPQKIKADLKQSDHIAACLHSPGPAVAPQNSNKNIVANAPGNSIAAQFGNIGNGLQGVENNVAAQFFDNPGGGIGNNNPFGGVPGGLFDVGGQNGAQGSGQGVAGIPNNNNNNNNFPGNNIFNIAPEKLEKVTTTTVCLNHGRPDPTPRMTYKIVPVESVVQDASIIPLLARLGKKGISHGTIQAAVWHLENGLSWQKIYDLRTGPNYLAVGRARLFSRQQIVQARKLVARIEQGQQNRSTDRTSASANYSR